MMRRHGVARIEGVRPSAELCVGRRGLAESVARYAGSDGCVLLYGGPLSGKTTLLRYIAKLLQDRVRPGNEFETYEIGLYVDARSSFGGGAEPSSFFGLLGELAFQTCSNMITDLDGSRIAKSRVATAEGLQGRLDDIFASGSGRVSRIIFLIDNSRCVLEWSREFHNNLNTLLYGSSERQMDVAMVFAGGKELQLLLVDTTSPIGARAVPCYIENLKRADVSDMVRLIDSRSNGEMRGCTESVAGAIWGWTGGHAGLSCRIARRLVSEQDMDVGEVVEGIVEHSSELFGQWNGAFTETTAGILNLLQENERLSRGLVKESIRAERVDRVWRELQYMGVANADGDGLMRVNQIFWDQWKNSSSVSTGGRVERDGDDPIKLIEGGESDRVEFKATLREGIDGGQEGRSRKEIARELEHEVLKSLAAFLNTDGGVVFVGVDDRGESVDLVVDRFVKEGGLVDKDRMLQHLASIMKQRMQPLSTIADFAQMRFVEYMGKQVLMIKCQKADRAVFLEDRFFKRVGTTTQEVRGRDLFDSGRAMAVE